MYAGQASIPGDGTWDTPSSIRADQSDSDNTSDSD
jgi:hypothetical protein